MHAYLGPNGQARPSRSVRCWDYCVQTAARRLLDGDPWRDAVELHRRIAYVPGDVNLWRSLSGGEIIDMLGRFRGWDRPAQTRRAHGPTRTRSAQKSRTYSKGNRQKVALVAGLASDAELLILDEPTSGLDPLMETVFQQLIFEVKEQGRTVLLSSHILAEVEKLCDRVTIIRQGRAVQTGTLDDLRVKTRTSISVATARPVEGLDALAVCTGSYRGSATAFRGGRRQPRSGDHSPGWIRRPQPRESATDVGRAVPAGVWG